MRRAEWTGATKTRRTCPHVKMAIQNSNPGFKLRVWYSTHRANAPQNVDI